MTTVWKAQEKRAKLIKRQKNRCHWCREPMTNGGPSDPRSATLDHVVPKSKGGGGNIENLVAACQECNRRRGSGPKPPPLDLNTFYFAGLKG